MNWRISPEEELDAAIEWFRDRTPISAGQLAALEDSAQKTAFWMSAINTRQRASRIQKSLQDAMAHGMTFETWRRTIARDVDKIPEAHLRTTFRNWTQTAYNQARVNYLLHPAVKKRRPYWMFDAVNDGRTSKVCTAYDGTVLEAGHPWFMAHTPPLHHNCRSSIRGLTPGAAKALGIRKRAPQAKLTKKKAEGTEFDPGPVAPQPGFGRSLVEPWKPRRSQFAEGMRPPRKPRQDKAAEELRRKRAVEAAAAIKAAEEDAKRLVAKEKAKKVAKEAELKRQKEAERKAKAAVKRAEAERKAETAQVEIRQGGGILEIGRYMRDGMRSLKTHRLAFRGLTPEEATAVATGERDVVAGGSGRLEPIKVSAYFKEDGTVSYTLVDGRHRATAASEAGATEIRAVVRIQKDDGDDIVELKPRTMSISLGRGGIEERAKKKAEAARPRATPEDLKEISEAVLSEVEGGELPSGVRTTKIRDAIHATLDRYGIRPARWNPDEKVGLWIRDLDSYELGYRGMSSPTGVVQLASDIAEGLVEDSMAGKGLAAPVESRGLTYGGLRTTIHEEIHHCNPGRSNRELVGSPGATNVEETTTEIAARLVLRDMGIDQFTAARTQAGWQSTASYKNNIGFTLDRIEQQTTIPVDEILERFERASLRHRSTRYRVSTEELDRKYGTDDDPERGIANFVEQLELSDEESLALFKALESANHEAIMRGRQ